MNNTPRLKKEYIEKVRPELQKEFKLKSIMEVPRMVKIVLNVGLGEAIGDKTVLENVGQELGLITGQKPVQTTAKGAISSFKIRRGDKIGLKVTLRGNMMWEFLDRLISITFPRTRDFHGVPATAFDGQGNYTVGIPEQTAFPEIDPTKISKIRSLELTIVMSGKDDKKSRALLDKFGFPFVRDGKKV